MSYKHFASEWMKYLAISTLAERDAGFRQQNAPLVRLMFNV